MSVDGKWRLTVDTPMGKQQANIQLKYAGNTLTGRVSDDYGTFDAEIFDTSVDGDQISFKVKFSKTVPMTLKFSGTVTENAIVGKVKLGPFGTRAASATRV